MSVYLVYFDKYLLGIFDLSNIQIRSDLLSEIKAFQTT